MLIDLFSYLKPAILFLSLLNFRNSWFQYRISRCHSEALTCLLTDISFLINEQDRIGLTGKNGAGKTTLLKIISGHQSPTKGFVDMSKEVTIGYLPQQMAVDDSTTVMNETLTAFAGLMSLSEEIEKMQRGDSKQGRL